MSEYIRTNKFDTNECLNIFIKEKLIQTNVRIYICDQYIRIFEYIRHTLLWSSFALLRCICLALHLGRPGICDLVQQVVGTSQKG